MKMGEASGLGAAGLLAVLPRATVLGAVAVAYLKKDTKKDHQKKVSLFRFNINALKVPLVKYCNFTCKFGRSIELNSRYRSHRSWCSR